MKSKHHHSHPEIGSTGIPGRVLPTDLLLPPLTCCFWGAQNKDRGEQLWKFTACAQLLLQVPHTELGFWYIRIFLKTWVYFWIKMSDLHFLEALGKLLMTAALWEAKISMQPLQRQFQQHSAFTQEISSSWIVLPFSQWKNILQLVSQMKKKRTSWWCFKKSERGKHPNWCSFKWGKINFAPAQLIGGTLWGQDPRRSQIRTGGHPPWIHRAKCAVINIKWCFWLEDDLYSTAAFLVFETEKWICIPWRCFIYAFLFPNLINTDSKLRNTELLLVNPAFNVILLELNSQR